MKFSPYLVDRVVSSFSSPATSTVGSPEYYTLSSKETSRRLTRFRWCTSSVYASMRSGLTTAQVSRSLLIPRSQLMSVNLHHYVCVFLRVSPKIFRIILKNIETNIWQIYYIFSRPPVHIWDYNNNSYILTHWNPVSAKRNVYVTYVYSPAYVLNLILLMWRIWLSPNNASR
jgi:hypothetical protein